MNIAIAIVAQNVIWKNSKVNIANTKKYVAEIMAKHPHTDIILFPEISLMGGAIVDDGLADIAETLDGYCVTEVKNIAIK